MIPESIADAVSIHGETTIASWYSGITLFVCAALLQAITGFKRRRGDRFTFQWALLALTFLMLSLDEAAAIHERSISYFDGMFGANPLLRRGWVVPRLAFSAVFGIAYLPFLLHLPSRVRRRFLISGVMFVSGAVGMEMVGGLFETTLSYRLGVHVEEGLEMLAIVLFIYTLLRYIKRYGGEIGIRIT